MEANILAFRDVLNEPMLGSFSRINPETNLMQQADCGYSGDGCIGHPFQDKPAATLAAPLSEGHIQVAAAKRVGSGID